MSNYPYGYEGYPPSPGVYVPPPGYVGPGASYPSPGYNTNPPAPYGYGSSPLQQPRPAVIVEENINGSWPGAATPWGGAGGPSSSTVIVQGAGQPYNNPTSPPCYINYPAQPGEPAPTAPAAGTTTIIVGNGARPDHYSTSAMQAPMTFAGGGAVPAYSGYYGTAVPAAPQTTVIVEERNRGSMGGMGDNMGGMAAGLAVGAIGGFVAEEIIEDIFD